MKEEKDDLEKSVESLRTALRQQEQSAGRLFYFVFSYTSLSTFDQTNSRKRTGISK